MSVFTTTPPLSQHFDAPEYVTDKRALLAMKLLGYNAQGEQNTWGKVSSWMMPGHAVVANRVAKKISKESGARDTAGNVQDDLDNRIAKVMTILGVGQAAAGVATGNPQLIQGGIKNTAQGVGGVMAAGSGADMSDDFSTQYYKKGGKICKPKSKGKKYNLGGLVEDIDMIDKQTRKKVGEVSYGERIFDKGANKKMVSLYKKGDSEGLGHYIIKELSTHPDMKGRAAYAFVKGGEIKKGGGDKYIFMGNDTQGNATYFDKDEDRIVIVNAKGDIEYSPLITNDKKAAENGKDYYYTISYKGYDGKTYNRSFGTGGDSGRTNVMNLDDGGKKIESAGTKLSQEGIASVAKKREKEYEINVGVANRFKQKAEAKRNAIVSSKASASGTPVTKQTPKSDNSDAITRYNNGETILDGEKAVIAKAIRDKRKSGATLTQEEKDFEAKRMTEVLSSTTDATTSTKTPPATKTTGTGTKTTGKGSGKGKIYAAPDELKDEDGVKAYQEWAKSKGYESELGKPGVDGKYGDFTKASWEKHKEEYLKEKSTPVATTTDTTTVTTPLTTTNTTTDTTTISTDNTTTDTTTITTFVTTTPIEPTGKKPEFDVSNAAEVGMDLGRILIGAIGASKDLPEYQVPDAWKKYVNKIRQMQDEGLSPEERAYANNNLLRNYAYGIQSIRNQSDVSSSGAALGALVGLGGNMQDAVLKVLNADVEKRNRNLNNYGNVLQRDMEINTFNYQQKYQEAAASRNAYAQLAHAGAQQLTDRMEYNRTYGKGSKYDQLMDAYIQRVQETKTSIANPTNINSLPATNITEQDINNSGFTDAQKQELRTKMGLKSPEEKWQLPPSPFTSTTTIAPTIIDWFDQAAPKIDKILEQAGITTTTTIAPIPAPY